MNSKGFLRPAAALDFYGISRSGLHRLIRDGLFPPAVPIGARAVAFPSREVEMVAAARTAGHGEDAIRLLVAKLVAQRAELAAQLPT